MEPILYLEPWWEELVLVQVPVLVVDGVVEGEDDHLRHVGRWQTAWNQRPVRGAEAVRQRAVGVVAYRRGIGVVGRVAPALVAPVETVGVTVAEQLRRQT